MYRCKIAGCTKPHKARGLCATHYAEWRLHSAPPPSKRCKVDGCPRRVTAKGLCSKHYQRLQANGDPEALSLLAPAANNTDQIRRRKRPEVAR